MISRRLLQVSAALPAAILMLSAWGAAQDRNSTPAATGSAAVAYQINPAHTGAINTSGLKLPLKVQWSVNLGASPSYPVIAGGEVFVVANNTLYALNARNGKTIWTQAGTSSYGGWIGGVAYDNGMVFIVTGGSAQLFSGAIYAYSAVTGQQVWSTPLPNQYAFSSSPTALNGMVYTGAAGIGGTVYAVQESDGSLVWTASVENGDDSSPAVNSGGVFVSYACPQSYRFQPATGTQIWHYSGSCEGGGGATTVLYDGLLYVRDAYFTQTNGLILSAQNGTVTGGFNSTYAPAFHGSTAYYTESTSLTAFDIRTGETLWIASPPVNDSYSSSPIIVNGVVYEGTAGGLLLGYGATTGQQMFSTSLGGSVQGGEGQGMAAAQGMLVAPAGNSVIALTGQP